MARKVSYQAPFDLRGNLMHYPEIHYVPPKDCEYIPGKGYEKPYEPVQPDWREVVPFEATMTLEQGVTSGRSAKYLHWQDENGHRYPMFVSDLVLLVLSDANINKGVVSGKWIVCKRGANYGIRFVEDEK